MKVYITAYTLRSTTTERGYNDDSHEKSMLVGACQPIVAPAPGITPADAELSVPRFEPSECKYPILADADAEYGYLVVAEDRSNPDSPTIRVHVIKFRSAGETPAPDPVIVIPGGPGASGPFYAFLWSALPVADHAGAAG